MAPLGPFGPAPRLAVGVSGGPHSLALALLAQEWALSRGGVAHGLVVDHGLRAASAAEAAWTMAALRQHGMAADILTLGLPHGGAVQERARSARLGAMLGRCAVLGLPWLLLGQHRGDQAETLLFRGLRGSGEAGLAGMASARATDAALVLRPLLDIPPVRLEALLALYGLAPLRDPSNLDPRFARARMRLALDDPDGTGAGTAALAEAARAFAVRRARRDRAVATRLAAALRLRPQGWARLDATALGQDAVAAAALAQVLRLLSGHEHAPGAAAVSVLLARGQGTLHGVQWRDDILCREPAACAPPVPALPGACWDGRWRVRSAPAGAMLGALGAAASSLGRRERGGMPALVLAGLPALWWGERVLGAPGLGLGAPAELVFAPVGGPLG